MLRCYRILFILFIADSMGVSESLEGRYLQNLSQVIKSNVCPLKDRSSGAERVFFWGTMHQWFYIASGWSLLLPTVSHLRAAIGFRWCFQAFHCLCTHPDGTFGVVCGIICIMFIFCFFLYFVMFEELVEICDLMLYLMDLHRHLFHSLFNQWLKHRPRRDVFVKCKLIVPFDAPES